MIQYIYENDGFVRKEKEDLRKILALCLIFVLVFSSCAGEKKVGRDFDFLPTAKETLSAVQKAFPEPVCASVGGEWTILNGCRFPGAERSAEWEENYYKNLCAYVEKAEGKLSATKSTDYARVLLTLSALGKGTVVSGYDLLKSYSSMEFITKQGVNGANFALITMNFCQYSLAGDVTEEKLIAYILENEYPQGGWALKGEEADADITAQTIQALTPYYGTDEKVKAAVDRAVALLSEKQRTDGGFFAWDGVNSQTTAEVIVALTGLGIDIRTDERFIKEDGWMGSFLMQYYLGNGEFCHTLGQTKNAMATDSCLKALIAILRFDQGLESYYGI